MTLEQKARAYDEALQKAKKLIVTSVAYDKSTIEKIFPELKESEDERMWKLIKKYAHYNISDMVLDADHITREQLESWLEKQGDQNTAWSEEYEKLTSHIEGWLDILCDYLKDSRPDYIEDVKDVVKHLKSLRPQNE